jgi:ferritin-like metal-binding protein YciE
MADLQGQLTKYLTDAYSIEQQALAQLRTAPDIAGDPELERIFREHLVETEDQERRLALLIEKRDASPSRIKDVVMAAGGKAFILFARSQPDTTGKLTAHAHSYEALEEASYELLAGVAERAGEDEVAAEARLIRDQETQMRERLANAFDAAAAASLHEVDPDDMNNQLCKYLADAHAIEAQAIQLLQRGPKIGGEPQLEQLYARHLDQSRDQQRRVEDRLDALGGSPNRLQDAAMRLGALNWGAFFQAQPDTAGKLAAFAYAFEHLEIGGYELLKRVAERAGDDETVAMADSIIVEERAMAGSVAALFGVALEASLAAQGVSA